MFDSATQKLDGSMKAKENTLAPSGLAVRRNQSLPRPHSGSSACLEGARLTRPSGSLAWKARPLGHVTGLVTRLWTKSKEQSRATWSWAVDQVTFATSVVPLCSAATS